MPTPHTGTALSLSHIYSTRFYVYPLLLTNHFNRKRNFNFNLHHCTADRPRPVLPEK